MRTRFVLSLLSFMLVSAVHVNAEPQPPKFFGTVWQNWTNSSAEPEYIGKLFNQITPENAGKWGSAEPTEGDFQWARLDAMFERAESAQLVTKQHCFVWGQQQPNWVNQRNAKTAVTNWMQAFMTRYGDKVDFIDVVNEPLHATPSYRRGLGRGWDWMIWSFEQARIHAPNAKLLLNDYNILNDERRPDRYMGLIKRLQDRGLIDGIGLQAHNLERTRAEDIRRRLDRLATTGLPIYISEYEANIADDQRHLNVFSSQFPVFWEHPAVKGVTIWGFRQGTMWRNGGHLVRADGSERQALTWLRQYFAGFAVDISDFASNTVLREGDPIGDVTAVRGSRGARVTQMELTIDDESQGVLSSEPFTWQLGTLPLGSHTLTVIGYEESVEVGRTAINMSVIQPPSPGDVISAINCGGGAFTAADGTVYTNDVHFTGGSTFTKAVPISGTTDDTLYQSERYGTFTYNVPVPNGTYDVLLQFAEIYATANEARIFDVRLEDAAVVEALDIHAAVGHNAAHDVLVRGVTVSDGTLTIATSAAVDTAKLSAFRIMFAGTMITDEDGVDR